MKRATKEKRENTITVEIGERKKIEREREDKDTARTCRNERSSSVESVVAVPSCGSPFRNRDTEIPRSQETAPTLGFP